MGNHTVSQGLVTQALEVHRRGWTPLPIKARAKMPGMPDWTRLSYASEQEVTEKFTAWAADDMTNLGVLLGEPSGGLVDIDLDHPQTNRLKRFFLPPTQMITGRAGRPGSHYWYVAEEGTLPGNRRHKMPPTEEGTKTGAMAVELRSTGSQTLLPPSVHPSGEEYVWDSLEWGEPAVVDGRVLAVQVALLGLGTVLIDSWPVEGSRHEAYLALAGGFLRDTDGGVHPFWERNLEVLIRALAEATNDDDGADSRVAEVMPTTLKRIKTGELVQGFGALGEVLGSPTVKQLRTLMREVESAAGYSPRESSAVGHADENGGLSIAERVAQAERDSGSVEADERDPLSERVASWQPVDLEPYLAGRVRLPDPEVMARTDGKNLMYRGRVNMLYGSSESAKSWIALNACLQEMAKGERVMYLDFEDEPISTLERLQRLGAGNDDIRSQFTYIRPEEPLAPMQRNRFGQENVSQKGRDNLELFEAAIESADPSIIVADGMTVLYGLHGLDSNDSVSTDVITTWLKKLTRNGRSTVLIIDHTTKNSQRGTFPIGSQHKTAMVQGTLLQVWPLTQPRPGRVGEVELIVMKDRPGRVREISLEAKEGEKAQITAQVTIDSTVEDFTKMMINPPREAASGEIDLSKSKAAEAAHMSQVWEERVLHVYGGKLGTSLKMVEVTHALASYHQEGHVKSAVARLVDKGWLQPEGNTRGRRYTLIVAAEGYSDASSAQEALDLTGDSDGDDVVEID